LLAHFRMPKKTTLTSRRRGESSLVEDLYIVVKFKDDFQLPKYVDAIERDPRIADSTEWQEIQALAPGATFFRIYRKLRPEQIEPLSREAVKRSTQRGEEYRPPQFLNNYLLQLPPGSHVARVLDVLLGWGKID